MYNKIFRKIAVILIRLAGVVFSFVSFGILYQSLFLCKNLVEILSVYNQIDLSLLRLIGLFCLNIIGLLFDWALASMLLILGIAMILYKTTMIKDLINDI